MKKTFAAAAGFVLLHYLPCARRKWRSSNPLGHPNEIMMRAHFPVDNPRRSAIFAMESTHSWQEILWVRASWSLPLNLKLPADVYFHISLKKVAPLLLFLSYQSIEKFLPRILFTSKMEDINFPNFESSSRPNFWLFYII